MCAEICKQLVLVSITTLKLEQDTHQGREAGSGKAEGEIERETASVAWLHDIPENNTSVLGSSSSMFPYPSSESGIDGSSHLAVGAHLARGEPGVDDQASAGIETIGLRGEVDVVDSVQQGGRRHLGCLLSGASGTARPLRGQRVHGQPVRHVGGFVAGSSRDALLSAPF
jgi:hypothetical protein